MLEPIVQSRIALSGDLGWRLDTVLIVALLGLVLVENLLTCFTQVRIRSFEVLGLSLI